jgi:Holliday junction DNA helicase RuvB
MGVLEIDAIGLDATDRRLLAAIIQKFGGGPVGVAALGAVLAEEVETVEDVYEPFLLRIGFLDRTPQGRVATDRARAHLASLGYAIPPRRADREPSLWEGAVGPEPADDADATPGATPGLPEA